MESVSWPVYDALAGFDESLLLSLEHAPPYDIGMLSVLVGRKTMKSASHIVKRQHAVFAFDIFDDGTPMFVVVELGA